MATTTAGKREATGLVERLEDGSHANAKATGGALLAHLQNLSPWLDECPPSFSRIFTLGLVEPTRIAGGYDSSGDLMHRVSVRRSEAYSATGSTQSGAAVSKAPSPVDQVRDVVGTFVDEAQKSGKQGVSDLLELLKWLEENWPILAGAGAALVVGMILLRFA